MEAPRTTEVLITSTSPDSFEDAINEGIARAARTLRGVQDIQIRDQRMLFERGNLVGYQVNLVAVFDAEASGEHSGVVLDPDEYHRLLDAAGELEDVRAFDEALLEVRLGEDELTSWKNARVRIEEERDELRRRGEL
jgi:flavin-binding protein dodecin